MKRILAVLAVCALLSGCATSPIEMMRGVIGNSTREVEESRPQAMIKEFNYSLDTCYSKTEELLKKMPRTSIYYEDDDMIAVFYVNPNTTPVGIFFTAIDPDHTKVEISSPASDSKEWIARNVFEEKVLPAEKVAVATHTGSRSKIEKLR